MKDRLTTGLKEDMIISQDYKGLSRPDSYRDQREGVKIPIENGLFALYTAYTFPSGRRIKENFGLNDFGMGLPSIHQHICEMKRLH